MAAAPATLAPPAPSAEAMEDTAAAKVRAAKLRQAAVALAVYGTLAAATLALWATAVVPVPAWVFLVPAPLLGGSALHRLVAWDGARFPRLLAANLVRGLGLAGSLVLLVHHLDRPPLVVNGWSPVAFLAVPQAAWGIGAIAIGGFLYDQYRLAFRHDREREGALLAGAGIAILLAGAFLTYPIVVASVPEADRVPYALPLVLGVLILTPVVHVLGRRDIPYVSVPCRLVGASAARNLAVAIPLATYLAYRTTLADNVRHLALYEWGLGLALLGFILHRVKTLFKDQAQEEPTSSRAKRHVQVVSPLYDPRFASWDRTIQSFVDQGEGRDRYETLWTAALKATGMPDPEVHRALADLLEYRDLKPGFLDFPWRRKRLAAKNRQRRLDLHRSLMSRFTAPTLRKGRHHG